ncbi:MAG: hypothetical protein IJ100_05530 [Lachnospiraceae bacterium]|nr:hypothetical protein [Lachnospiraceae bacterium]
MKLRVGKAGENTLDRSIIKRINAAGRKGRRITMSADPITYPVSQIGELAVYAAINALSAEKFVPESFRSVILLPPGTEESVLREIMDQICRVCSDEHLVIEGGHTEVTSAVTRPVVIGACTGSSMDQKMKRVEPNDSGADQIILTKWAGMEGSSILARDREELQEVFPETILMRMRELERYLSVRKEAQICVENGAQYLVDLSEGGIYAALWRLFVKAKRGFVVDLMDIPVLQETIEFANHYDIDPYRLRSGGSLLAVTRDADSLIEKLAESGIPAARIGELSEDRDKILRNEDEIRYLDLPQPDELLKIMQ